jgi:hypothetical protein
LPSPTVLFCPYLRIVNMDCSVVGIVGVLDMCVAPCVTMVDTSGLLGLGLGLGLAPTKHSVSSYAQFVSGTH